MARALTITADSAHTPASALVGWSIREAAGSAAAAAVKIRDATSSGQILAVIELAANGSETVSLTEPIAVTSATGVYVEVVSGTIAGVLHVR